MKNADLGNNFPKFIITGASRTGKSSILRALEREFFRCFQEVLFNSKGEYRSLESEKLTICEMNDDQIKIAAARGSKEFALSNGVIFLVDLAFPHQFPAASRLLGEVLNHTTSQTELAILAHKSDITGTIPIDEIIHKLQLGNLPIHRCHTFSVLHTSVMEDNGLNSLVDWVTEHFCEIKRPFCRFIREIFIHDSNGIPLGYVGDISMGDTPILVTAVYSALETFLEKIGGTGIKTFVLETEDGPVHIAKHSEGDRGVLFVSEEPWSSPSLKQAGRAVLKLFESTEREFDDFELSVFDRNRFLEHLDEIFFSSCPACERFSKKSTEI